MRLVHVSAATSHLNVSLLRAAVIPQPHRLTQPKQRIHRCSPRLVPILIIDSIHVPVEIEAVGVCVVDARLVSCMEDLAHARHDLLPTCPKPASDIPSITIKCDSVIQPPIQQLRMIGAIPSDARNW